MSSEVSKKKGAGKETSTDAFMTDASMDESVIAEYLSSNPDFFQRHSSLLETIQVPHDTGTTSLIERQVAVLREKSRDLEEQLNGLISAARGNEQTVTKLQRFTLELMRAEGVDDVIATCQEILRQDFNADYVTLKLISNDKGIHFISPENNVLDSFSTLFETQKPVCGRLKDQQQQFLFGGDAEVNSTALIPLFSADKTGILALGSSDESRFHPGMGTVFISYLGELISTSITHHSKS
ncbi:MAG: DUF484 family protein [Cocleimonas sp.]